MDFVYSFLLGYSRIVNNTETLFLQKVTKIHGLHAEAKLAPVWNPPSRLVRRGQQTTDY